MAEKNSRETVKDWLTELMQEVRRTRFHKIATLVPILKKKDKKQCANHSLLSVPGKVLTLIFLERLQVIIDPPQLMEAQCGYRNGCGTVDQIWDVRQVMEKAM